MSDELSIGVEGRAGRITLTRPEALNALTYDMSLAIEAAIDQWRDDDAVELVVIDGEGEKAFCAGGDIQKLYATGTAGDYAYGQTFWHDEYRLNAKIANYPKPYVSLMDGIVMGGGVGVSAHGSHRVVTDRAMVAMPEVSIGFLPDVGGTYILSRAPGHVGEYLGMTANRMNAADAIYAGFADAYVPADHMDSLIAALCGGGIATLDQFTSAPPAGKLAAQQADIDAVFSLGDISEIIAALEASGSDWAQQTVKALRRNAPLSVVCALNAVRAARGYETIEDCLALEYRFVYRSMEQADFLEGIRAAIIDKDRNPQWRVATLEEVTAAQADALLASLGDAEWTF
jgi:enoyl-CoA hydratase